MAASPKVGNDEAFDGGSVEAPNGLTALVTGALKANGLLAVALLLSPPPNVKTLLLPPPPPADVEEPAVELPNDKLRLAP